VIGRYSTLVNGFTGAAITRFDILDVLPKLRICTGYDLDGTRHDYPPASAGLLARCQPIYEELPGWESPTAEIRRFEDLPPNARAYVQRVERLIECPVSMISVGPGRDQTIMVRPFP
jgi:adenylosuccinate synthase